MDKQAVQSIKEYFGTHREELVSDLLELIRAESPSNNKEYANRCLDVLCGIVEKRLGVKATRYPQEQYGDHALFTVGNGGRKILLIGHYDTVWEIGAKETKYEGDIVTGSGCFDMKYGVISSIWSLKAIFDLGLPFDKTVHLFYNSDEEVGSRTSMPLILANPKEYEAAVILEPSHHGGIKTERKGVGMFEINIKGIASHSGSDPEKGVSAIEEAARITTYLHSMTNYETGTTLNVGVFKGGTRSNVVAAECSMSVDLRVRSIEEGERIIKEVMAIKPSKEGLSVEVKGGLNRPPFEKTKKNMALYDELRKIAENMDINVFEISVGGGSDGNFTSHAGIPTIDGMGAVGDGGHALSEHVIVSESLERTMLLAGFWTSY